MQVLASLNLKTDALQDAICADERRHLIFRSCRRRAKSWTAAKRAFSRWIVRPGTRTWIVGPSYDLAHKEFRYVMEFTRAFCRAEGLPQPEPVRENPSAGDLLMRTCWGSEVIGKSAQKPEMLVGEEIDGLIMSEAAMHKRETWERYLRPTLSTRGGETIWPFTPDAGGLWLYELELHAAQLPDWGAYTGAAWDCPWYPKDEIEAAQRELSEDAFAEQYGGEWRFYTGRVFKYNAKLHEVEPFEIPSSWPIYSATDFGFRDPTCTLWLAKSPSGEGYFIDEYYQSERATPDHCKAMLEQEQKRSQKPLCKIADHHGLGRQLILDASRAGWKTVPCRSEDRRSRRERAETLWECKERPHPYHVREGKRAENNRALYPGWFVFRGRCPNLVRELQFLRWKDTSRNEGAAGVTEGDDHAVDCSEYLADYLNLGVAARTRKAGSWQARQPACALTGY